MNNPFIETYTGEQFHPLDPVPEEIHTLDLAHALANNCRYTGHSLDFYSVAEHSVNCMKLAQDWGLDLETQRWALLHDAGEAYLADMAAPIKDHFPYFRRIEEKLEIAIAERYGLWWPWPDDIKRIDRVMLMTEAYHLLPSSGEIFDSKYSKYGGPVEGFEIQGLHPEEAKRAFLQAFENLFPNEYLPKEEDMVCTVTVDEYVLINMVMASLILSGEPFTSNDVRDRLEEDFCVRSLVNPNNISAAFRAASIRGDIERTGKIEYAEQGQANNRTVAEWQSVHADVTRTVPA